MRLALFTPYGVSSKEVGLIYLVSNYLSRQGAEVALLRCDGAVPACARDRLGGIQRTPFQCSRCSNEQRTLAAWGGIRIRDISADTHPDDLLKTSAWLQSVPVESLGRVEFRGVNLWAVCQAEFSLRWDDVDLSNLSDPQEEDLRRLFASYVRVVVASERFLSACKPSLVFASSAADPLVAAYITQAAALKIETAVFSYDESTQCVVVEALATGERYVSNLVLEGVSSMRPDPRTWGPEVTAVTHELLTFLGYPPDRVR